MTAAPDILCLGEAMVEFVLVEKRDNGDLYRQGFGGDTSNTAIAVARLGGRSGYISAVGQDVFGTALRQLWESEGVNTSGLRTKTDAPTGVYFVDPDPVTRRFTYLRKGSAASCLTPADLPGDLISSAKILHVSGISLAISDTMRAACFAAADIAQSAGCLVSFDPNYRSQLWDRAEARDVINRFAALSDIFLPSIDDVTRLTGLSESAALLTHYRSLGVDRICLKKGAEGYILDWDGKYQAQPAYSVQAVDSTGAGDAFAGGFLLGYLESGSAIQAADLAARTAALATTGHGAIGSLPDRQAVAKLRR